MIETLAWLPLIAAGISAAGSLAGGLMSSAGQASQNANSISWAREQQEAANAFSAAQAQKQMDFQERMSNSQYQRGMADMKLAGLNPILAYQQGGASAPQGAMGSPSMSGAAKFENAMEGLGRGVTSASKGAERAIELTNVAAQTKATNTQAELNNANTQLSTVNAAKAAQDTSTSAAQMRKADAETANVISSSDNPAAMRALMAAQGTSAYSSAGLADEQRKQLKEYGPHWSGQVAGSVGRIWDLIRGLPNKGQGGSFPLGGGWSIPYGKDGLLNKLK